MKKEKIDDLIKKFGDLEWYFPWERAGLSRESIQLICRLLIEERNKDEKVSEMQG